MKTSPKNNSKVIPLALMLVATLTFVGYQQYEKARCDYVEARKPSIEIIDELIAGLSSSFQCERSFSAFQLQPLKAQAAKASPYLVPLLTDTHADVRWRAAGAIGDIGVPNDAAHKPLMDLLDDPTWTTRANAVYALTQLRVPGLDEQIVKASYDSDQRVKNKALIYFGNLGIEKTDLVVSRLVEILDEDGGELKQRAMQLIKQHNLMQSHAEQILPRVVALSERVAQDSLSRANQYFANDLIKSSAIGSEAIAGAYFAAGLLDAIAKGDVFVKSDKAEKLARVVKKDPNAESELLRFLKSQNTENKSFAVRAIWKSAYLTSEIESLLYRELQKTRETAYIAVLLRALAISAEKNPKFSQTLVATYRNKPVLTSDLREIIWELAAVTKNSVLAREMFNESSKSPSTAMLFAIGELKLSTASHLEVVESALGDEDLAIRWYARRALLALNKDIPDNSSPKSGKAKNSCQTQGGTPEEFRKTLITMDSARVKKDLETIRLLADPISFELRRREFASRSRTFDTHSFYFRTPKNLESVLEFSCPSNCRKAMLWFSTVSRDSKVEAYIGDVFNFNLVGFRYLGAGDWRFEDSIQGFSIVKHGQSPVRELSNWLAKDFSQRLCQLDSINQLLPESQYLAAQLRYGGALKARVWVNGNLVKRHFGFREMIINPELKEKLYAETLDGWGHYPIYDGIRKGTNQLKVQLTPESVGQHGRDLNISIEVPIPGSERPATIYQLLYPSEEFNNAGIASVEFEYR